MPHKVRLLDKQGCKITIVEVETNILAGKAIVSYQGRYFTFGNIVGNRYADFDFVEVDAPFVLDNEQTFKDAWSTFEKAGYRYGGDALENVRFGWDIAKGIAKP